MKTVLFYNGSSGSLGRYVPEAAARLNADAIPLKARLEDTEALGVELRSMLPDLFPGSTVTLLQLAALVSVPECEKNPEKARQTNVLDSRKTVEVFIRECQKEKLIPQVIYVSTGHIYAPKQGRLSETDVLKPRSVYASTKLEGEKELSSLCRDLKVRLIIARVFGLIAPIQAPHYVLQSVIRRSLEKNLTGVPGLSNLRDYLDSRDVCMTLLRLAETTDPKLGEPEILNICSGDGVEIAYLLEAALKTIYPNDSELLTATITEGEARADDIREIIGDPSKIEKILGRNPKAIPVEQTIRDAIAKVET